jgi:TatD DNase family protein
MIDTHTHLYDEQFEQDRIEMIQRAIDSGVERMYLPNCDATTIEPMFEVERKFPNHCFAMMGLHPCYVKENVDEELNIVRKWLDERKFCAVGEIGLDYYWDKSFVEPQKRAFRTQIEWALEFDIPIVIHTREATKDTIDIVKEYSAKGIKGVFHCFSGSYETAMQIIDMGFYLGIGGVLTYKNAGLQEVVQRLDLKHLVLETDAPYLTPAPFRGKRNESHYVHYIAQKLSELKDVSIDELDRITTTNANELFKFSK